jgi:hypothetical protein
MATHALADPDLSCHFQHIQCMMNPMVIELPRQLRAELGENKLFGSTVAHIEPVRWNLRKTKPTKICWTTSRVKMRIF